MRMGEGALRKAGRRSVRNNSRRKAEEGGV
jgi:hypothetical protein